MTAAMADPDRSPSLDPTSAPAPEDVHRIAPHEEFVADAETLEPLARADASDIERALDAHALLDTNGVPTSARPRRAQSVLTFGVWALVGLMLGVGAALAS